MTADNERRDDRPVKERKPKVHPYEDQLVGIEGQHAIWRVKDGKRKLLTSTRGLMGKPILVLERAELDAIPEAG